MEKAKTSHLKSNFIFKTPTKILKSGTGTGTLLNNTKYTFSHFPILALVLLKKQYQTATNFTVRLYLVAKPSLRLLSSTNNERGDLFTRLVADLFYALGYDDLRFDVHKTGREIDIQGSHRRENRLLVAECKAHAKQMGGAELNKFLGVVTRERKKDQHVSGYFVSLGGFTESALEQELASSEDVRIIPIDVKGIIAELTKSKILITQDKAVAQAGRCAEHAGLDCQTHFIDAELIGHTLGYIWAVYYERGKEITHFALIHADGNPLSETAAASVIEADRLNKGSLNKLTYLAPSPASQDRKTLSLQAMELYKNWLDKVCGFIQLDGLPAEGTIASKQMKLENLFVPLKLQVQNDLLEDDDSKQGVKPKVYPVGSFIKEQNRFSILAKPGGGKSTLLKRLAVAYADPARRLNSEDHLPQRDWLPLLLRCRDLRERTGEPIRQLLCDLGRQAEMDDNHALAFRELVDEALNAGRALLLVDGLDEFADAAARTTFANNLRVFLGMYPHSGLVVTSREAGFRQIAGVVASVCVSTTMAPFDEDDVHTLCQRWHAEVLPDTQENRGEALKLADAIWNNERIRALAENPLMLTTLLVVKRNVGELPTKRVKLYAAAISVLIRTWNIEGFAPLNEEETLARLSYIAVDMMRQGKQRIGKRQLLKLLQQAQKELEEELAYAEVKPNEFIDRVEYRSSLLMQTGYEENGGILEEVYEFRHLTFQEYLAARGLVEEQYPGRDDATEISELLSPYFEDELWREVIPLAAVMANRKAERLIQGLTEICSAEEVNDLKKTPVAALLRQCILDEIQVKESTLRDALLNLARFTSEERLEGSTTEILRGKFGAVFQKIVEDAFFGKSENWHDYESAICDIGVEYYFGHRSVSLSEEAATKLEQSLASGDPVQQGKAAQAITWLVFQTHNFDDENFPYQIERFHQLWHQIESLLGEENEPLALCLSLTMVWMGITNLSAQQPRKETVLTLFNLWRNAENAELRRIARWAFGVLPLLPRETFDHTLWGDCSELFNNDYITKQDETIQDALSVLAWYRNQPWSQEQLIERLKNALSGNKHLFVISRQVAPFRLLNALGAPGKQLLAELLMSEKLKDNLGSNILRILKAED